MGPVARRFGASLRKLRNSQSGVASVGDGEVRRTWVATARFLARHQAKGCGPISGPSTGDFAASMGWLEVSVLVRLGDLDGVFLGSTGLFRGSTGVFRGVDSAYRDNFGGPILGSNVSCRASTGHYKGAVAVVGRTLWRLHREGNDDTLAGHGLG